jgi:transcription elongation factor Elf1
LCVDCWEEEHHRSLPTFREKLKYYNNYTPKQNRHGKPHNNTSVLWCPYCYSHRVEKKGIRRGKQRYYCKNCGKNWTFEIPLDNNKEIKKESNTLDHEEYKNNKHSSANDENVLAEKILQYLKNNPGEKASTIARNLGVDKSQINSLLYLKLKEKCVAKNFCWYLKGQLNEKNADNFTREFDIETIKTFIKNRKANNKPIVFYYLNDSFPRIFHEYYLNGNYIKGRLKKNGHYYTFLLDKIRKLE